MENISTISDISTSLEMRMVLQVFWWRYFAGSGDIISTFDGIPHRFCLNFDFDLYQVEIVEVVEILFVMMDIINANICLCRSLLTFYKIF
jgi:hypothetical protein